VARWIRTRGAIEALGAAVAGADRLLVVSSGAFAMDAASVATEESEAGSGGHHRVTESAAVEASSRKKREIRSVSRSPDEAAAHFGPFASADRATSSARTRETLDWNPSGRGLLEGIEKGRYFDH
jgi:hypothetical protein